MMDLGLWTMDDGHIITLIHTGLIFLSVLSKTEPTLFETTKQTWTDKSWMIR
jgi:hypothetical protein